MFPAALRSRLRSKTTPPRTGISTSGVMDTWRRILTVERSASMKYAIEDACARSRRSRWSPGTPRDTDASRRLHLDQQDGLLVSVEDHHIGTRIPHDFPHAGHEETLSVRSPSVKRGWNGRSTRRGRPHSRAARTPRWFPIGRSRHGILVWIGVLSTLGSPDGPSTTSVVDPPPSRFKTVCAPSSIAISASWAAWRPRCSWAAARRRRRATGGSRRDRAPPPSAAAARPRASTRC